MSKDPRESYALENYSGDVIFVVLQTHLASQTVNAMIISMTVNATRDFPGQEMAALKLLTEEALILGYCSENKKIKVYKICINGDFDGFEFGDRFGSGGEEAEVRIRLDGIIHYPTSGSSCRQKPRGFCKLKDGLCHKMDDAPFQSIEGHRSITVGVEEFDKNSRNEKLIAVMSAKDWYADTCDKYEIILSRDFKSEKERSVCMDFGISGKVRTPDFRGEIGLSAGVQSCTRWVDPAESFIWYMEVVPSD